MKNWNMASALLAGMVSAMVPPFAEAGQPQRIADVNQRPEFFGLNPSGLVAAGGKVYFRGWDREHGHELWMTDGTAAGTRLVRDLKVGQNGSFPGMLCPFGDRLIFFADDGESGMRPWITDGSVVTPAGSAWNIYEPNFPTEVIAVGGTFYFIEKEGTFGRWLGWGLRRGDGTENGTVLLNPVQYVPLEFPPSRAFGYPKNLTKHEGNVFFSNPGGQIWRAAGTPEQTVKVADIGPDAAIISLASGTDRLWFTADRAGAKELWSLAANGPEMIASIEGSARENDFLTSIGSRALFAASDVEAGFEMWTSDGTETHLLADIRPGAASSQANDFVRGGDRLYFTADDGVSGRGIWVTDGNQVWLAKGWEESGELKFLTANEGVLYFIRRGNADVLWRSDGTESGTVPVAQVTSPSWAWGQRYLMASGGRLFLSGNDGVNGEELWSSDGTQAGTGMLFDLGGTSDGFAGTYSGSECAWKSGITFCGNDGTSGEEPWETDGTAQGTRMIADVRPGAEGSAANQFTAVGGDLFFTADDGTHGREPWISNATGTSLLRDFNPGNSSSYPREFFDVGGHLIFHAQDDPVVVGGFWVTDGVEVRKLMAKAGPQSGKLGVGLLFAGTTTANGEEVWWTDGEVVRMVADIRPGTAGSSPGWFNTVGNEAYFQCHDGSGFRLWRTDGSTAGTGSVAGWTGPGSIYPMVASRDRLYFFEEEKSSGIRLWTAVGGQAVFVKQIGNSTSGYAFPFEADSYVQACGGMMFFAADDNVHGNELWRSDGTEAGTVMVKDIRPGPTGSGPAHLKAVGGVVYFQANDGVSGEELWVSDGTSAGTRLVADIATGPGGSAPVPAALAGNRLFFAATTQAEGTELHLLDVSVNLAYHAWSIDCGLEDMDAVPGAAPEGDGIVNLLKYAFGLDGSVSYQGTPAGLPGHLPLVVAMPVEDGHILRVEYVRRLGGGLIYTAKRSPSLAAGSFVPMGGDETTELLGNGWERVVRSEKIGDERCFAVVEVAMP